MMRFTLLGRNDSVEIEFFIANPDLNPRPLNCIAVERRQQIPQLFCNFYPPTPLFFAAHGQLKCGFALRSTPNTGPAKQA
jgi:hypothetical protein